MHNLQNEIEHYYGAKTLTGDDATRARRAFLELREALTFGQVRAAEKHGNQWQANAWVKQGILLGFRLGELEEMSGDAPLSFVDKSTYPARRFKIEPITMSTSSSKRT